MRLTTVGCLVVALVTVYATAQASTIYVSPTGSDTNDGLSWPTAQKTVQAGLNAAAAGDHVWVAAGTYVENITLKAEVALYGGFAGSETALAQRDWSANVTVLDGNRIGPVVRAIEGATETARIDGFTICNGKASSAGGGIYCSRASLTIANNMIADNTANVGGGIYVDVGSPTISNNRITRNSDGGGIYCADASPTIAGNTITDNKTRYYGGGVWLDWCFSATVAGNTINGNTSPSYGGGICCTGDTWPPDGYAHINITGNTITGNSSISYSVGNPKSGGGGIYCDSDSWTITNNTIASNTSDQGGGIYTRYNTRYNRVISNNRITGNGGAFGGGGIYCSDSPVIANNLVSGNGPVDALYAPGGPGGGIFCASGSYPTIVNNTIIANCSPHFYGGGIHCASTASPTIVNTLIAWNTSGICKESGSGTPSLQYSCVYGNSYADYLGLADPTGSDGNISIDPKIASFAYGNLRLQPDSPCVDAGDGRVVQADWLDLDGQARTQGPRVDIGADESDGVNWSPGPHVIVHVAPDGSDAQDGSTWARAKRTVQAGIDAAAAAGGEVWVKAGVYPERVFLRDFAHVFSGFNGTETQRATRDWLRNVTVLDGGQNGTVVTATGIAAGLSTIDGFTIRNGKGYWGGGLYCFLASPTIANNTIIGNMAARASSSPSIDVAPPSGGGIYAYHSSAMIVGNTIANNSVLWDTACIGDGGGIYCNSGTPTILGNTIAGNRAMYGGGISSWGSSTIAGNTVVGNSGDYGGGIYCSGTHYAASITNNTIVGNSAVSSVANGGAIYCDGTPASITNTIAAFNSSGIYKTGTGTPLLQYNCIFGNTAYNFSGLADPTGTDGNISVDPLLARLPSSGADGTWGTADDDYGDLHLLPASPCINTGDPAYAPAAGETDLDGQPRVLYGRLDIGADEYRLAGDCNYDGFINVGDLQVLVPCWASSRAAGGSYSAAADLNNDGYINVGDLQLLVAYWGESLQ